MKDVYTGTWKCYGVFSVGLNCGKKISLRQVFRIDLKVFPILHSR